MRRGREGREEECEERRKKRRLQACLRELRVILTQLFLLNVDKEGRFVGRVTIARN